MGTQSDLNVIRVGDKELLLTLGGGQAIHLTREASEEEEGVAAAPDHYLDDLEATYDKAALENPRWLETTLCGRRWILMASGEDTEHDEAVFAPTCRRCLALMDKHFPQPTLDSRFPVVVQVVTDTIVEYGDAEILSVPGDQQAALRKEVRAAVRKRTGYGVQTYVHESMVIFVCRPIYDQHADVYQRELAEAMNRFFTEERAEPIASPRRLSWDTWAAH
jgi:hypothetical protein